MLPLLTAADIARPLQVTSGLLPQPIRISGPTAVRKEPVVLVQGRARAVQCAGRASRVPEAPSRSVAVAGAPLRAAAAALEAAADAAAGSGR